MPRSVDSAGKAVPLESLVRRAREILAELPPMQDCDEHCRASRAARAVLRETHGRRSSWTVFSQYIPQLEQVLGRDALRRILTEALHELRDEGCTNADIQQVASGQFGPQNLSVAALNTLAFVLRVHVDAYIARRLTRR